MRKNKNAAGQNAFSMITVDDDELMTSALQAYFQRSGYQVDTENNPVNAIERVKEGHYDILLLDFLMTPICGDKVIEEIRKFNKDIFIILLTGHKSMAPPLRTLRELDIQGYYEKSDRFDQLELLVESCVKSIRQMRQIRSYQSELNIMYQTLNDNYMEIITVMRTMVDARDEYTRGHSDRVAALSRKIGEKMGMSQQQLSQIHLAGLFHDIGKIGVPDGILLKPGKLTIDEYEIIKHHPQEGERILSALTLFKEIAPIVRSHHERVDGSGYPDHLKGEAIPLHARIIAVADAFDAMTSNRHYRRSMSIEMALDEIRQKKGTQFDEQAADAFLQIADEEDLQLYI
ncbi:MAG: HD domain-containing protein [Clostridia bacterium]|nr:HD domain-containing protein [Clostridia bacterium]